MQAGSEQDEKAKRRAMFSKFSWGFIKSWNPDKFTEQLQVQAQLV